MSSIFWNSIILRSQIPEKLFQSNSTQYYQKRRRSTWRSEKRNSTGITCVPKVATFVTTDRAQNSKSCSQNNAKTFQIFTVGRFDWRVSRFKTITIKVWKTRSILPLGPCKGGYPSPPSEFQSLVCRYFGRFPCRCRNFDKTSAFRRSRIAVSRPCR